jgi:release factor glutamine methyltransferase
VAARRPDPLPPGSSERFRGLLARRERREPLQYLTGEQEFRGLAIRVDRRVLVPRPETEELVDAVLRWPLRRGARVADLGTGSGCIAIALTLARPDWVVAALDRSEDALQVARENAARHGVDGRISFRAGDLAAPPEEWASALDVVVSNPPYVSEEEWRGLAPEVRDHEPKGALVPGPTGIEAYESLAPVAARLLVPDGAAFVELGYGRSGGAREAFDRAGFASIDLFPDVRGIPRILRASGRGSR